MKLKLIDKKQEIDNIYTFIFEPDKPIIWQAGQYLHYILKHDNPDDRGIERWFTIASAPYEKNIKITTRFTNGLQSTFKQALHKLKLGEFIDADSPEGDFVVEDLTKKFILIAGGIGITPYYAILKQLNHDQQNINADLIYLSRDKNMAFATELEEFAKDNPSLCLHLYDNDRRISDEELKEFATFGYVVYISGPKTMVGYYFDKLNELHIKPENLKKDYFPGYQNA